MHLQTVCSDDYAAVSSPHAGLTPERPRCDRTRAKLHKHLLPLRPYEADSVAPGLILGGVWDAHNLGALKEHGVTHIVTVVAGVVPSYPEQFEYMHVSVRDIPEERLSPHLDNTTRFIHDAVSGGGTVYVHCMQGKSRSATVVLAYLMQHLGMPLEEALAQTQARRAIVEPNAGFMEELRAFESGLAESGPR